MKEIKSADELDEEKHYWVFFKSYHRYPALKMAGHMSFYPNGKPHENTRIFGPIDLPTLEQIEKECE